MGNTENTNDHELDESLRSYWGDVTVPSDLKSSTLAAIARARVASSQEASAHEEGAPSAPSPKASAKPQVKVKAARGRKRFFAVAAAVLVCAVLAVPAGNAVYHTETAYASIDSTNDVTLGVNRFGCVVSARSDDPETQEVAAGVVGMQYSDAIEELASSGCLGDPNVDVSIGGDDAGQTDQLVTVTQQCLEKSGCCGNCNGMGYGQCNANGNGNGQMRGMMRSS